MYAIRSYYDMMKTINILRRYIKFIIWMRNMNNSTLYIVATPIGNLGDITFRAVETLKNVDIIAAEDTRRTIKLLNYYEIHTPMMPYHQHNRMHAGEKILSILAEGKNVALVTDAGMPCRITSYNVCYTKLLHCEKTHPPCLRKKSSCSLPTWEWKIRSLKHSLRQLLMKEDIMFWAKTVSILLSF